MKGVSGSHSDGSTSYKVSDKGTELLSVNFTVSRSVELISVWVQTENPLGSANSSIINYTLSKIGKTHISYHQLETNDSRDETCGKKKKKKQEKIFRLTEGYDNVMMLWVEFHANSAVETVLYLNLEVYGY